MVIKHRHQCLITHFKMENKKKKSLYQSIADKSTNSNHIFNLKFNFPK